MPTYTSGQYKYLLMKRLQRHFSMQTAKSRAYTQTFFWTLFDGVEVTEEAYDNFVSLMDDQLEYMAENGIYLCEDIPEDAVIDQSPLLVDAFSKIGINLVIDSTSESGYYQAIFTKSDGTVLTYKVSIVATENYFYINSMAGTEYLYAKASSPSYTMQNMEVLDADELDPRIAGPETYWNYNSATSSVTITGDGSYAGATTEEQLGSGAYTTVIASPNVSRLLDYCVQTNVTTIVLLHPKYGKIKIDSNFNFLQGVCSDTQLNLDVYTDCYDAIQQLSDEQFSEYITIHDLSDWEG